MKKSISHQWVKCLWIYTSRKLWDLFIGTICVLYLIDHLHDNPCMGFLTSGMLTVVDTFKPPVTPCTNRSVEILDIHDVSTLVGKSKKCACVSVCNFSHLDRPRYPCFKYRYFPSILSKGPLVMWTFSWSPESGYGLFGFFGIFRTHVPGAILRRNLASLVHLN